VTTITVILVDISTWHPSLIHHTQQ